MVQVTARACAWALFLVEDGMMHKELKNLVRPRKSYRNSGRGGRRGRMGRGAQLALATSRYKVGAEYFRFPYI
jgi:hypothetical protein